MLSQSWPWSMSLLFCCFYWWIKLQEICQIRHSYPWCVHIGWMIYYSCMDWMEWYIIILILIHPLIIWLDFHHCLWYIFDWLSVIYALSALNYEFIGWSTYDLYIEDRSDLVFYLSTAYLDLIWLNRSAIHVWTFIIACGISILMDCLLFILDWIDLSIGRWFIQG